jgi:glyoxylase-like metal-dependent hydrolase (beta-lactamase superfamily II)
VCEVWVHERGAKHLVDPTRLVASAKRVYGDDFDRLWGDVVAVPDARVRALRGDERIDGWRVAYTPGHASHHVSYLLEEDGSAFVGDIAGVRIGDGPAMPPTPPPDIDRELWLQSLVLVGAWQPTALRVTHFGTFTGVEDHVAEIRRALAHWGEVARATDGATFAEAVCEHVEARTADPDVRRAYEQSNPPNTLWDGWARYWSR